MDTAASGSARGRIAWALYEGGRSPYFVLVNIYIFGPFFTRTVVGDPVRGQSVWGLTTAIAALMVAIAGPLLGAVVDARGRRKPVLGAITLVSLPAMAALWLARPGAPLLPPLIALVVAGILVELSTVVHNSMLPRVAGSAGVGGLSGLGLGLGNGAAILLLGLFVLLAGPFGARIGFDPATHAPERAVGAMAAIWYALLAIPLFLFAPDEPRRAVSTGAAVRDAFAQLVATLRRLGAYRNVARFIVARMIYNDAFVVIFYFSGIYIAGLFGWSATELTLYGVGITAVAALSAVIGGRLDDRIGSRRAILLALVGCFVTECIALVIRPDSILGLPLTPRAPGAPAFASPAELIFIANGAVCTFFIVLGFASSRTMLARIAPPEALGEFFGLYALSGYGLAFVAPLAVGIVTGLTGSQQGGFIVVLFFLAVGFVLMRGVRMPDRGNPTAA